MGVDSSQVMNKTPMGSAMAALANENEITVKQSMAFWEAISQGCCEQSNVYKVYTSDGTEIMTLKEDSDCMNRCCCAPQHTYKVGMLGMGEGAEVIPEDGFAALNDRPVLLEREGCCSKLLCCFSMTDCCANHAEVMVPETVAPDAEIRKGKFRFEEKLCNGCSPEIVIYDGETEIAMLSGPTFFGGCSELCCDYDYAVSASKAGEITGEKGDICIIEKKKPEGCCAILSECMTDSDNFEIHFNPSSPYASNGEFKAVMLGALVYLDFMFFEFDNGMCEPTDQGGIMCTFFNCYVCGCICPCSVTCNPSGEGGEGGE